MTTARHTAPPSGVDGDSTTTTTTSEHSVRPSEYLRQWTSSPPPNPSPAEGTESETAPSPARSPFEGDPKIFFAMAQPSGVTEAGLIASLKEKVGATHVEIEDMSGGCGQAFSAIIVSPQFEKKTTLARHRMVNTALKAEVAAIHAWTPKCFTPEQWEKLQEKNGGETRAPGRMTNGEVVEGTTA